MFRHNLKIHNAKSITWVAYTVHKKALLRYIQTVVYLLHRSWFTMQWGTLIH